MKYFLTRYFIFIYFLERSPKKKKKSKTLLNRQNPYFPNILVLKWGERFVVNFFFNLIPFFWQKS